MVWIICNYPKKSRSLEIHTSVQLVKQFHTEGVNAFPHIWEKGRNNLMLISRNIIKLNHRLYTKDGHIHHDVTDSQIANLNFETSTLIV